MMDRPDVSPEDSRILSPGTTTLIPVWLRGDKIGKQSFRFLFGYQSEDKNDRIAYRTLPYTVATQVMPSLRINAFTKPSTRALNEFILGIEVENMQSASEVVIKQLSSISASWTVEAVETR